MIDVSAIQSALAEAHLGGWLFYDHHHRDPLAYRILQFGEPRMASRRWYYFIPASGEPQRLVHRIESTMLDALPGARHVYSSWAEQTDRLRAILGGVTRVAMQYSPQCAIPLISNVDAGTVELIRGLGVEVVSSADLVQQFEARWSAAQLEGHLEAGRRVDQVLRDAFALISSRLDGTAAIREYDVQQFIRRRFTESGMVTDHGPIVGVNANAANPHYEPTAEQSAPIQKGDLVLIDLWAKLNQPDSVYYDITWTGYCGPAVPDEIQNVFTIVTGARDAAVAAVKGAVAAGRILHGYQVDDAARNHIRAAGFGEKFVHRTGHSIGTEVHGAGANMDNLETHDDRRVMPWTCFSVEPGVYLDRFGIRSEVNVFVGEGEARVTGAVQDRLVLL
jgi:Xaa-Pro dipeptidase